jgi:hypothetical protein
MTPTTTEPERELAHRTSDAIDISLYRNERTKITVKVYDARSDEGFELDMTGAARSTPSVTRSPTRQRSRRARRSTRPTSWPLER